MKFVDLFGLMELFKFLQCTTIMKWKKKKIVLRILAVMSFTVNVCCAVSSGSQGHRWKLNGPSEHKCFTKNKDIKYFFSYLLLGNASTDNSKFSFNSYYPFFTLLISESSLLWNNVTHAVQLPFIWIILKHLGERTDFYL